MLFPHHKCGVDKLSRAKCSEPGAAQLVTPHSIMRQMPRSARPPGKRSYSRVRKQPFSRGTKVEPSTAASQTSFTPVQSQSAPVQRPLTLVRPPNTLHQHATPTHQPARPSLHGTLHTCHHPIRARTARYHTNPAPSTHQSNWHSHPISRHPQPLRLHSHRN